LTRALKVSQITIGLALVVRTGALRREAGDRGRPAGGPRYEAARGELMMFTRDVAAILQADPWESRLDLIERAVEAQTTRRQ